MVEQAYRMYARASLTISKTILTGMYVMTPVEGKVNRVVCAYLSMVEDNLISVEYEGKGLKELTSIIQERGMKAALEVVSIIQG